MDNLKSIVLGWLPTLPAKVTLLLTLLLATTPFLLPDFLFPGIPLSEPAQLFLLKVAMSLLVLLAGACAILALVLIYTNDIGDLGERLIRGLERTKDEQ
jgi:hypothetical protein